MVSGILCYKVFNVPRAHWHASDQVVSLRDPNLKSPKRQLNCARSSSDITTSESWRSSRALGFVGRDKDLSGKTIIGGGGSTASAPRGGSKGTNVKQMSSLIRTGDETNIRYL